ncbi:MAG: MBL fold metallo-hydrolase [Candidatus Aenigmarchaeota archaeon]|nr:MBL fold metallo-hydrolase [Candidatus Aenigmarchaeota archaeon]
MALDFAQNTEYFGDSRRLCLLRVAGAKGSMNVFKHIAVFNGIGYDSNVFLLDGEILVDTGSGTRFPILKKGIGEKSDASEIKTIVNTHCHFDHCGGNKKFRSWLGAEIAAHRQDKPFIESGINTMAELFKEKPLVSTVDKELKNGSRLKTANFSFEVIATPGHTPGSVCLYENEHKILVSGDTLFEDGIGRADLPGGSNAKLYNSLEKLSRYHINYLLPGHGNVKVGGVDFLIKQMLSAMNRDLKI